MNHKNSLTLFLGCFLYISTFAQEGYHASPSVKELEPGMVSYLENRLSQDIAEIPYTGKTKKLLKQLYVSRYDQLMSNVSQGLFLDFADATELCDELLAEIVSSNPEIPGPVKVFVTRDPSPNARCMGDGTMFIHIGLIIRLETEAQLAFVLCHELAHYQLNHVNNNYAKHARKATDIASQREIDKAIRTADNPYEAMVSYFEGEAYQVHRHSRLKEIEADSLGLKFMLNTSFELEGVISALEVLKTVDEVKYKIPIPYHKLFGNLEQPFDDDWLIYQPYTNYVYGQNSFDLDWEIDSLATHPDCTKRLRLVNSYLDNRGIDPPTYQGRQQSPRFREIEKACDLEWVYSYYHFGAYGKALFYALQLTEVYPEEPFVHSLIGRLMAEIYLSKKAHNLGTKIDHANPLREEAYNQFLTFARSLRLKEWEAFGLQYLEAQPQAYRDNEEFMYSLVLASSLGSHPQELTIYTDEYWQRFPDGWYADQVRAIEAGMEE